MSGMAEAGAPLSRAKGISWKEIAGFLFAALLIRIYKGIVTPVIAEDGVVYLEQAILFGAGETAEALRGHYPPLYPALIAIAHSVIPDPVWSGKAVSALFGSAAICPFLILGRSIFPAAAVRMAAVVYILSPLLLIFSGDVLSESPFVFFVLLSLAAVWKAGEGGRLLPAALAGVSAGLASLTRPEGVLLIPFGLAAIWLLPKGEARRRSGVPAAALFATLSLFPLIPYTLILRTETGQVQFTRKGAELAGGLERYADEKGVDLAGSDRLRREEETGLYDALSVIGRNAGLFIRKYLRDLSLLAVKSFPHAIHPIGLGLFLLGIILHPPSNRNERLLLGFLVWYLVCIAVNYANPRFLAAMVAPAILWCGVGLDEVRGRLVARFGASPSRTEWILVGLVAAGLGIRAFQPERLDKLWMKDAGQVIRSTEESPTVCSRWRRLAFYAGGDHLPVPRINDYRLLLDRIREGGATHLGLPRDDRTAWFLKKVNPADLDPVFTTDSVTVFRLLPAATPSPEGR